MGAKPMEHKEFSDWQGEDFARRLRQIMRNDSVNKFAQKTSSVGESSLRQYLGGGVPGLDKAMDIAKTAGVSLDWLATGVGDLEGGRTVSSNEIFDLCELFDSYLQNNGQVAILPKKKRAILAFIWKDLRKRNISIDNNIDFSEYDEIIDALTA